MIQNDKQISNAEEAVSNSNTQNDMQRAANAFDAMVSANSDVYRELSSPVLSVSVTLRVVIGSTKMSISSLLSMDAGSSVELQQKVGDPVDIVVNERVIAKGELCVSEGDRPTLFVTITELLSESISKSIQS